MINGYAGGGLQRGEIAMIMTVQRVRLLVLMITGMGGFGFLLSHALLSWVGVQLDQIYLGVLAYALFLGAFMRGTTSSEPYHTWWTYFLYAAIGATVRAAFQLFISA